jgi:hypothetical protein
MEHVDEPTHQNDSPARPVTEQARSPNQNTDTGRTLEPEQVKSLSLTSSPRRQSFLASSVSTIGQTLVRTASLSSNRGLLFNRRESSGSTSSSSSVGEMGSLRDKIKDALVLRHDHTQYFLPEGVLEGLLSERAVTGVLEPYKSKLQIDIPELTHFVQKKAKKMFAILVYIQKAILIQDFYKNKLTDESLPLQYQSGNNEHTSEYNTRARNRILQSLSEGLKGLDIDRDTFRPRKWSEITTEDFCNIHQWTFLAPVFKEGKFRYQFHEHIRMPFLKKGGKRESNFSVVQERVVHRHHLLVSSGTVWKRI